MTSSEAVRLLHDIYGLDGSADRLPSEVDDTFRIAAVDGKRYTLKVAAVNERGDVLGFQTEALRHLERRVPQLPVPRVRPTRDGAAMIEVQVGGQARYVRLLSWLDGVPMHASAGSPAQSHALGRALGMLDRGLADYRPVVPDFELVWDITHSERVAGWTEAIGDAGLRALTDEAFAEARLSPALEARLPRQVIHNDINPHNVIVDGGDADRIAGIIDFGDLVEATRINDLAIALSYQVGHEAGFGHAAAMIAGYRGEVALTSDECIALRPRLLARLAMTIAITTRRAADDPGHANYILRNRPASIAGLERLSALPSQGWATILEGKLP
ncbi:phosphotransferase [Devosia sp.]|uniref:phosphotransferase n=1 Tax=Devosia sp. TaxID=1871048 RepID=UPI001AC58132|nr:phosphotransferase [Devosia sp.]MBN9332577.1 phosphotransferase [Devosia sp.]